MRGSSIGRHCGCKDALLTSLSIARLWRGERFLGELLKLGIGTQRWSGVCYVESKGGTKVAGGRPLSLVAEDH